MRAPGDAGGAAARRRRRARSTRSLVLDLSGHESSELEVVAEGGSMPTPAMLAWARELQVGSWYMLDYRDRNEAVQLAWQGLRKQLSLFVTPQGRCVLFQQHRLAAFLQAGLLLPAQDEALTVRATRTRAGQAGRRPGAAVELSKAPAPVARSVDQPLLGATNSSSRISASGSSPRLQNTISTMIFRSSRSIGAGADGRGAVDHHLAHRRRQHAGRFEEADEADRLLAQQILLGRGVHAQARGALLPAVGLAPRWPGRRARAALPGSRRVSKPTAESLRVSWAWSGQASGRQ